MLKKLRIATRKSPLALWQAEYIAKKLTFHWPELELELIPMTTSGDQFLKDKLLAAGGKGLFVKELEEALLDNRADIAVHSMKDVPSTFPDGLILPIICTRENPLDAFVSEEYDNYINLPQGAVVGTASLRRQSQLLALRPDLTIKTLRGNVNTRLGKMQAGEYQAIILAAAGLERLGLENHIKMLFSVEDFLPACGQGALGIECRISDEAILHYIQPLNDPQTSLCVNAERKVNALLGGNCHVPLGVYCTQTDKEKLIIRAKMLTPDGKVCLQSSIEGSLKEAIHLANQCAEQLINQGALELLKGMDS